MSWVTGSRIGANPNALLHSSKAQRLSDMGLKLTGGRFWLANSVWRWGRKPGLRYTRYMQKSCELHQRPLCTPPSPPPNSLVLKKGEVEIFHILCEPEPF